MKSIIIYSLSILVFSTVLFSQQNKKTINAKRVNESISVDGILDENIWNELTPLKDFVQFAPYNGKPADQRTEAFVCYDDEALYVAAIMYDTAPDSICTEIGDRDDMEEANVDLLSVHICPYNDGINSVYFDVSAAGVQADQKLSAEGNDLTWDAVWESSVAITDYGWLAEIKIPYSALRFPKSEVQDWGFNIFRKIQRYEQWTNWSYVSNEIGQWWQHYGILAGIKDIDPPVRLSFSPYVSSYAEKNGNTDWESKFNGGMDLKYGISESFTLDVTLIPDFGQVQSDDEVLNLSPYEQHYNEKRQFFTEGTELFNKGDLFYSRRIGSLPRYIGNAHSNLGQNEIVTSNPIETKLINATKVSGRTESGLGIGILNAMTQEATATIRDTLSGIQREVVTQPFTNYNVFVLDQTFGNNSYVSLINSNVAMKDYLANVTAAEFRVMDNSNNYGISGSGAYSYQKEEDISTKGFKYNLKAGKFNGIWQYAYEISVMDDKYNPNDLGYLQRNNEVNHEWTLGYNIFQPFGIFRNLKNNLTLTYSRLYNPSDFTEFRVDYEVSTRFENNTFLNMHAAWIPVEGKDYYEARAFNRYVKTYKMLHNCLHLESDKRKDFTYFVGGGITGSYDYEHDFFSWWYDVTPGYRFSDKFSMEYDLFYSNVNNEMGYVNRSVDQIYFGKRERSTLTNTLVASYILNNRSSISFRLRHYWSKASYDSFYELACDGELSASSYTANHDVNYNAFNIDMTYKWIFAPGSELILNWKNSIYSTNNKIEEYYFTNLKNTLEAPQINSISIKILYYLDYLSIF